MQNFKTKALAALTAFAFSAGSAYAAVDAAQAAKLGKELTPVGAEMAGNVRQLIVGLACMVGSAVFAVVALLVLNGLRITEALAALGLPRS